MIGSSFRYVTVLVLCISFIGAKAQRDTSRAKGDTIYTFVDEEWIPDGVLDDLDRQYTPMMAISGFDSERTKKFKDPDAGDGGAWGMDRYFGTYDYGIMKACGLTFVEIIRQWVADNELRISKSKAGNEFYKARVWRKDLKGLFEVRYVFASDASWARVAVSYYPLTGEELDPALVPELADEFNLDKLWSKLQLGMACQ